MNNIQKSILMHLSSDKYLTASELAERLLLSEKTIRNYIKEINQQIKEYQAEVISKHGYGYLLKVKDSNAYSKLFASNGDEDEHLPENFDERCEYIIDAIINHDSIAYIDELADSLHVSEYTLQADLNRMRKILHQYKLKLTIRNQNEIAIEGDEFFKRIFLLSYCSHYNKTKEVYPTSKSIYEIILKVLGLYNISISEISIRNLVNHLSIALIRIREGMEIGEVPSEALQLSKDDNISSIIANLICDELEAAHQVKFSTGERDSFALHLFGHRVTGSGIGGSNVVISQDIYDIAIDILQFIKLTLGIDQCKNLSMIMNLAVHLVSLDIRIKYNINLKNPLLFDIKKKYALGYTLALQAGICLEGKYHKPIGDDEIGYLALLFELWLKNERRIEKKNILIVCATGKTSAELLAYQYKELFGTYLGRIGICNLSELSKQDFSHVDYVLSTTTINIPIPVPILSIKMMMSEEDESQLKELFKRSTLNNIQSIYRQDLFFTGIKANDKEDAIRKMCALIERSYPLPPGFADSVIRREEMGATDFGETVALAHPYLVSTADTFASVMVLDGPVFWGNKDVEIVILISVSPGVHDELEAFYQSTSLFMLDKNRPRKLLKNPSYDNFISLVFESK